MKEIMDNLFVCSQEDFNNLKDWNDYSLCLCAKTFHLMHVEERNEKGNVPNTNPEYLIAHRPEQNLIALNLIDAPNIAYISKEIIDAALVFIHDELAKEHKVLIVCNQGKSRSACIGLMYMFNIGRFYQKNSFEEIEAFYKTIYPEYEPNKGMRDYTENYIYQKVYEVDNYES